MNGIVWDYSLVVNVVAFVVYGIDKYKARKGWWRVPENALWGLAVIGGSIGAYLGVKVWHHKTMHNKFRYGIPAIILLQLLLGVFCLR